MNVEPSFAKYLIIFDGDLKDTDIKRIKKNKNNYLMLPTPDKAKISPEKVLDEFLNSEKANKYFEIEHKKYPLVSKMYFKENAVAKNNGKKDRENYKEWFNKHIPLFEDSKLFNYWKAENQELVDKFRGDFKTKYNYLASKNKLPMVD